MTYWLLENYYWDFYSTVYENLDIVEFETTKLSSDDMAVFQRTISGIVRFIDGSELIIAITLDVEDYQTTEEKYYYAYLRGGERVFSYDNSPHHPDIPSFPHHMHKGIRVAGRDAAYPTDIPAVTLSNILTKIRTMLQSQTEP